MMARLSLPSTQRSAMLSIIDAIIFVSLYCCFCCNINNNGVGVQGQAMNTFLNAYKSPLSTLTAPNTYYFLEFPTQSSSSSSSSNVHSNNNGLNPQCGDGSPFSFVFRRGTDAHVSKLIVEFEGGPACWKQECFKSICNDDNDNDGPKLQTPWNLYQNDFSTGLLLFPELDNCRGIAPGFVELEASNLLGNPKYPYDLPLSLQGKPNNIGANIFMKNTNNSSTEEESKWWGQALHKDLDDWSYILIPHCTMDWHLGFQSGPQWPTASTCTSGSTPIYHRGGVNLQHVLDWVNEQFEPTGGLDALITTSGGRVGGCSGSAFATSIAPHVFAAGANMRQEEDDAAKLVLTEGSSLWNAHLPSVDTMQLRWNIADLLNATGVTMEDYLLSSMSSSASGPLEIVESILHETKDEIRHAWLANSDSSNDEELVWLSNMKNLYPDSFHLYFDETEQDNTDQEDPYCPLYSFPEDKTDEEGFTEFLSGVSSKFDWSDRSSTLYASGLEANQEAVPEGFRLTFFSISLVLVGSIVFAWICYFVIKCIRQSKELSLPPTPNDIWFWALTHHPRKFLLFSLLIPIFLSYKAYETSDNRIYLNLDFDTYLDIETDMEQVSRNFGRLKSYQRSSLTTEKRNCRAMFSDDDRRLFDQTSKSLQTPSYLEESQSNFDMEMDFSIKMNDPMDDLPEERRLQYQLYESKGEVVSILYQNRNGGSVFTPEVLKSIKAFEESISNFPGFTENCYNVSGECAPFDSVVPIFFPEGELVSNITSALTSFMGNPLAIWKVDQFFGPDNLASNITRTFIWFREGNEQAVDTFLERLFRDLLWKVDHERPYVYPDMVFTWTNGHLEGLEGEEAVYHDAIWAAGSFIFIGIMILLKVRNGFVFVCSMLGLALSFTTAYYWCLVHFNVPQITLLHVSSLFVMMGIGADDIFLMVDSFEHTKVEFHKEQEEADANKIKELDTSDEGDSESTSSSTEKDDSVISKEDADILRARLRSAYATAGSMMLVSSMTTSLCFFSNAFGVVVVIQEFGIYMGMVVLVNFIHVMTILPSAILVNELYLAPFMKRFCCFCSVCFCCGQDSNEARSLDMTIDITGSTQPGATPPAEIKDHESQEPSPAEINDQDSQEIELVHTRTLESDKDSDSTRKLMPGDVDSYDDYGEDKPRDILENTAAMNRMDRWLVQSYSPVVTARRMHVIVTILVMTLALGILGIVSFSVNNGTILLFSDKYNLGRLESINNAYFNADLEKTVEASVPTADSGDSSSGGTGDVVVDLTDGDGNDGSGSGSGSGGSTGGSGGGSGGGTTGGSGSIGGGSTGGNTGGNVGGGGGTSPVSTPTQAPVTIVTPTPGSSPGTQPVLPPSGSQPTQPNIPPSTGSNPGSGGSGNPGGGGTGGGGTGGGGIGGGGIGGGIGGGGTGGGGTDGDDDDTVADATDAPIECQQPCDNGGICTNEGICDCENGWSGPSCTLPICPYVNGTICGGQGSCQSHYNGIPGSTECNCQEGFAGSDCQQTIEDIETALSRREAIIVSLIWGADPRESGSDIWSYSTNFIPIAPGETIREYRDGPIAVAKNVDVSDETMQQWLYDVVQKARNATDLNIQPERKVWIEIVQETAVQAGIGFPIPKDLFVGFLDVMKTRNNQFTKLIREEVGTTAPGLAGEFLFTSLTLYADVVHTGGSLSEKSLSKWTSFVDSINAEAPPGIPDCAPQSRLFMDAHRSQETISSTATSWLIANVVCLAIILFFTQNIMLSFMVMAVIILIFLCLAGMLFGIFRLPFGPVEALGVSIFIGLSANYSLHMVHAYHSTSSSDRTRKVREAIFVTGSPIVASALSTIGGCLFLFFSRTFVFIELGLLICSITLMALLFSMMFLPSWLTMVGPLPAKASSVQKGVDDEHHDELDRIANNENDDNSSHHVDHQWDLKVLFTGCYRRAIPRK